MKSIPLITWLAFLALAAVTLSLWLETRRADEPPSEETAAKEDETEPSTIAPPPNQEPQWESFYDQMRRNVEEARQAREREEARQQAEAEAAEAERQRRKKWEKNFPYQPTYHLTLTYDPSHPEMDMAALKHGYMTAFFNNPQRFTAEFEQLYHMLKEIDRADNPKNVGTIFANLRDYHKSMRSNPKALWTKKKWVDDLQDRLKSIRIPVDGKTTWEDRANRYSDSIVGILVSKRRWPNKEPLDKDAARAMRDRLLAEIPSENLVKMPPVVTLPNGDVGGFLYSGPAERALRPGDRLLVPVLHETAEVADESSETEESISPITVIPLGELDDAILSRELAE